MVEITVLRDYQESILPKTDIDVLFNICDSRFYLIYILIRIGLIYYSVGIGMENVEQCNLIAAAQVLLR